MIIKIVLLLSLLSDLEQTYPPDFQNKVMIPLMQTFLY